MMESGIKHADDGSRKMAAHNPNPPSAAKETRKTHAGKAQAKVAEERTTKREAAGAKSLRGERPRRLPPRRQLSTRRRRAAGQVAGKGGARRAPPSRRRRRRSRPRARLDRDACCRGFVEPGCRALRVREAIATERAATRRRMERRRLRAQRSSHCAARQIPRPAEVLARAPSRTAFPFPDRRPQNRTWMSAHGHGVQIETMSSSAPTRVSTSTWAIGI